MPFDFNEIIFSQMFVGTVHELPPYLRKIYGEDNYNYLVSSPTVYGRMIRSLTNILNLPQAEIRNLRKLEILTSSVRKDNRKKLRWLPTSMKSVPPEFCEWPNRIFYATTEVMEEAGMGENDSVAVRLNFRNYFKII